MVLLFVGRQYINHLTSTLGKGKDIAKVIQYFLSVENIHTSELVEVGCYGTACNSGWKNVGSTQLMEIHLKKPFQSIICLLITNKRPLRQMVEEIDEKTQLYRISWIAMFMKLANPIDSQNQ